VILMFGARSFEVGEDLVDAWLAKIEARAAPSAVLANRLAALTATATSEDGLISVTVGGTGLVTGLTLDEAIRARPAEGTARAILATLRAAQVSLADQAGTAAAETVGRDSETGRAVLAAYAGRVGR
jgi:DNA-binding protein YbaB